MKKIGILTLHRATNFGAVLQAYALQQTVQRLGCQCVVIDYLRRLRPSIYSLFVFPNSRNAIQRNALSLLYLIPKLRARRRFANFMAKRMDLTSRSFDGFEDISANCPKFDAYISGSDQVWNPNRLLESHGRVFYLDFVMSRRIAYAPSFGVTEIPAELQGEVIRMLSKFDFLSAREDTGCDLVRSLTGLAAEHVLDPAYLLPSSEYDKVAVAPSIKEPYILHYPMTISPSLDRLVLKMRKKLKLPLVTVLPIQNNPLKHSYADRVVFDAGPSEFLGWMKNATFVCTNSFHGTAFSIIYRKNFLAVPATLGNTRLSSLLKKLGIMSRQVEGADCLQDSKIIAEAIDYGPVVSRLNQEIAKSTAYLKKALG